MKREGGTAHRHMDLCRYILLFANNKKAPFQFQVCEKVKLKCIKVIFQFNEMQTAHPTPLIMIFTLSEIWHICTQNP